MYDMAANLQRNEKSKKFQWGKTTKKKLYKSYNLHQNNFKPPAIHTSIIFPLAYQFFHTMVLPIVVGVGVTVVALTVRATISAYRQFLHLTPTMIATLNNIKLINYMDSSSSSSMNNKSDPRFQHYRYLRAKYPNRPFNDPMTEQEALLILGIEGNDILNVDKKMIRDRYRKLMILNHPDKNGSQYISQRINEAKDILDKSYMIKK